MIECPDEIRNILELVEAGKPVVQACKDAGLTVYKFYIWVEEEEERKVYWRTLMDARKLIVEDALFASALKGNPVAQLFYLKCRDPHVWNEHAAQQNKADSAKFKRRMFDIEVDQKHVRIQKPEKDLARRLGVSKDDIKRIRVVEEELSGDD